MTRTLYLASGFLTVVTLVALSGCAAPSPSLPAPLSVPAAKVSADLPTTGGDAGASANVDAPPLPRVPSIPPPRRAASEPPPPASLGDERADLAINVDQLPLPIFIQMVYGTMLKNNVHIDPKVAERKDLVSLRTGGPQTAAQVRQLTKLLLQSYGLTAVEVGNLVRVVPDSASLGQLPEILRGGALPDTPAGLRPAFYLIELQAVRNTDVAGWLRTLFGDRIRMQEDPSRNALLLAGTPDSLSAALEALRMLDQPVMHGRSSLRLSPTYWSVDDLARRLFEVLSAEGYAVQPLTSASAQGSRYPLILLPVSSINALLVFATSDTVLEHVSRWARVLDQPGATGIGRNFFTYQVRHKDAEVLAATLERLLSGRPAPAAAQAGATPAQAARGSTVVVDKSTNMLIFQGASEDYTQLRTLLATLDRPSRAALIEVTVAEVQLTDRMQFGVEWALRGDTSGGDRWTAGTVGGLAIGSSGFTYRLLDSASQVRAIVNALASDNRAAVLSSPRVMARNGETALIQVGQEVPIVTSQQSTLTGTSPAAGTGVLQTIQYRNTGVILRVKPVIHSSDQIDLDVVQEVSSAESTTTGVNVSPTFGTRRVETKLTLKNGSTVMLAGLISNSSSAGNSGVPGLKDIPVLGQLFRTDTRNINKTELIVLITPYVVNDDHEARAVTDAFRGTLEPWARSPAAGTPPLAPSPGPTSERAR